MLRLIKILLISLVLASVGHVCAQSALDDLIEQYAEALEADNPKDIKDAWIALNESETAVDYIQVNDADLYERFEEGFEQNIEDARRRAPSRYDNGRQAQDFPNQDRRNNNQITRDEPLSGAISNNESASEFRNQNRPSNQEMIKQRIEQMRSAKYVYGKDVLILSVSGVSSQERRRLSRILEKKFRVIKSIDEIDFEGGVVEYQVEIKGNADDFADSLDGYRFGGTELDLIHFQPQRIDFILKAI